MENQSRDKKTNCLTRRHPQDPHSPFVVNPTHKQKTVNKVKIAKPCRVGVSPAHKIGFTHANKLKACANSQSQANLNGKPALKIRNSHDRINIGVVRKSKGKERKLANIKNQTQASFEPSFDYFLGMRKQVKINSKPKQKKQGKPLPKKPSLSKTQSNPQLDIIPNLRLSPGRREHLKEEALSARNKQPKIYFRSLKDSQNVNSIKTKRVDTSRTLSSKPKSSYKRRVEKYQKAIDGWRSLSHQSEGVLRKIESLNKQEENRFRKQKQMYKDLIQKLQQQLEEYRPNIGHVFSYKEHKKAEMVPSWIIPEGPEQGSNMLTKIQLLSSEQLQKQGKQIIQKYLQEKNTQQSGISGTQVQLCLSILSNESNSYNDHHYQTLQ